MESLDQLRERTRQNREPLREQLGIERDTDASRAEKSPARELQITPRRPQPEQVSRT